MPVTADRSRRTVLQTGAAGAAALAAPGLLLAQPRSVKIGLIQPVSGAVAHAGAQCRLGARMAIDEVNAAGGIRAMGGAKLEALLGDSQSRPEVGVSEVERLHQEGAMAFIGCYISGIALPATQAAARYNTPFVIDVAASDLIVNRGLKNVFRMMPGFGKCVEDAIIELGAMNQRANNVAKSAVLIHEETEFGTGTAKLIADKLPGIGIKPLEIIKHATPTRDFSNVALRIRSLKPDLVIMSNYQNEYVLLARTLHQQKVDLAAMFSVLGGGFNYKFVKELPDVAANMIDFNQWYNPRNPKGQAMRKKVEAAGDLFTFEVYCAWNAIMLYADALERAGTDARDKVIAALETSTWSGHFMPYGATRFVNGQNTGGRGALLQATRTEIEVIGPAEFASAKPIFPRPKAG